MAEPELRVVVVEVTNLCNFSCPQCAYRRPATGRFIGTDSFETVVAEAVEAGATVVRFLGLGEPTLHPDIGRLLAEVRRAGLRSHLVSNGSFALRPALRAEIQRSFPDVLEISLDAATGATFGLVRGRGERYFGRLTAAVRRFLEQGHPADRRAVVSFVAHPETAAEIGLFRRQWEGLAEVRVRAPHNFSGRADRLPSQRSTAPQQPGCAFLEDRIAVAADGSVAACNLDFAGKHVLGRIGQGPRLATLWAHPKRLSLSASIERGTFDAQCSTCSRCAGLVVR
jgi:radical SAM protein with 4Fe4S-binding SPASM domain